MTNRDNNEAGLSFWAILAFAGSLAAFGALNAIFHFAV